MDDRPPLEVATHRTQRGSTTTGIWRPGIVKMQRLYGLAVLVAETVVTKRDMRPGATNLQRGALDAYQLHFEPLGALVFDDEYSG